MTVQELIDKLATMPPYAEVLFDDVETYRDITVELAAHDPDDGASLVLIGLEPE